MGFRYLTFDCYGTLIDWRSGIEKALLESVGKVRLRGQALLDVYVAGEKEEERSYKKYREVLRKTLLSMSGSLGLEVRDQAARRFAASVPDWPAFGDTGRFLREMGERGYRRYILSNVDTDLLEETIKGHHLQVDGFVTAEEVGGYKPGRGHWLRFLEKTGADKGEVLHVAQSIYHDVIPCQEMGIAAAWVNRYREALPAGVEPAFIVDSLASLAKLLD